MTRGLTCPCGRHHAGDYLCVHTGGPGVRLRAGTDPPPRERRAAHRGVVGPRGDQRAVL